MAIFTADEYGSAIEKCWLNKKDVTRLATRANIHAIDLADIPPPVDALIGWGWVDLLDTTEKGYPYFIVGNDGEIATTRHYGIVKLEWTNA